MHKIKILLILAFVFINFASLAHDESECKSVVNPEVIKCSTPNNNLFNGLNNYSMPNFERFLRQSFPNFSNKIINQDRRYFDTKTNNYIAKIYLGLENIDINGVNINVKNNFINIDVNNELTTQSNTSNIFQSSYISNSFSIPQDADITKLTKTYDNKNMVLIITIPKK